MSRLPVFGTAQAEARFDGTPPRVRTRSRWTFRAHDGLLLPLNEGMAVDYLGRATAATVFDSRGVSGSLAAAEAAFTAIDWDGDGAREEDAVLLSPDEALRYHDPRTGGLWWPTTGFTLQFDFCEVGNALVTDAPYWSFSNAAADGAYVALLGSGDGGLVFEHHNGAASIAATLPVVAGERVAAVAWFDDDGAVQLSTVRNQGAVATSARSAALAPADVWGDGDPMVLRCNEIGAASRGTTLLRAGAVFGGHIARATLQELL